MRAWWVLAVVMIAAPAAAADQFDLVCKGLERDGSSRQRKPVEKHYRVDLATKRWCSGACARSSQIQQIIPDRIVFRDAERKFYSDNLVSHYVDRRSGEWVDHWFAASGASVERDGQCEVATFSGISEPPIKF
jgi:hypothetical protein